MPPCRTRMMFATRPIQVLVVTLTASLSFPGRVSAGGVDWPFEIVSYDAKGVMSAHVSLSLTGNHDTPRPAIVGACPIVVLEVDFRPEPFWRRTWTRNLVTRQTHREALRALAVSHEDGKTVRIGMMGSQGLPQGSTACSWSARGLAPLPDDGRQGPIYAFFYPI